MNKEFIKTVELLDNSNFYYIITTNMQGTYSFINKHYSSIFKDIHGEILHMPFQITMHPDDVKVCEEVAAKCFANPDKLYPATIRKHDGKGGYVITQWEYKAMFFDNGEPEGIFCLGYDITQFIEERNQLMVAEQNLEDAQQVLDKKEEILKQIVFHQSHIIRQPVVNILGLSDILKKMEIDQNLKNIVDLILESTKQLDDVIKSIVNKAYE